MYLQLHTDETKSRTISLPGFQAKEKLGCNTCFSKSDKTYEERFRTEFARPQLFHTLFMHNSFNYLISFSLMAFTCILYFLVDLLDDVVGYVGSS